ncbi:MAG TPA: hypothetical protein VGS28_04585 [Candidatus Saccharimonadales bacterium]|nr:hypothetical protein [Candidatus Saccharimonadales bacterium]
MIGDRLDVYDLDLLASEIPLEEPALRINRGDLIVAAEKASEAKVRFGRIGKWAHRLYDKIGEWSDYTFDFENRSRLWVGVTIATVALSVIGVEALGFYVQGREGNPQPAVSGQVHPHHHARTHGSTEIRR